MDEIEKRVRGVIKQVAPQLEPSFSASADLFRDLGVKSASALDLLLGLEEEFGVSIPDDAFVEARTTSQITTVVSTLVSSAA